MEASKLGRSNSLSLEGSLRKQHIIKQSLKRALIINKDEALEKWSIQITQEFMKNRQEAEMFLHQYQDDFNQAFHSRYQTLLKKYPNAIECLPNPMRKKHCSGKEINSRIAQKLDGDGSLKKELLMINKRQWPSFSLSKKIHKVYPHNGTDHSILLDVVLTELLSTEVDMHEKWYTQQYSQLNPKTPDFSEKETLLYQQYQSRLQKEFSLLQKILKHVVRKKKKKDDRFKSIAWCMNPRAIGGCTSHDITQEFILFVQKDNKSQKLLKKAKR